MREVKKKSGSHCPELKKERHIVTWSQQEDDILRQQIKLHGTENWSIIASKFEDKTTRQCRRRWYTYLNSDFKRGGWSPEEDLLLCEAQKVFGNRWTEIAKVVSGRTDNAVKNRFSTLCKKKAKYEALVAKENNIYSINSNNKRVPTQTEFIANGSPETSFSITKIRRTQESDIKENCNVGDGLHKQDEKTSDQQLRAPFAVLIENIHNVNCLPTQNNLINAEKILNDDQSNKIIEAFLNKNDLDISTFVEQAELLSSLAQKVQTEKSYQSIENAWKVLKECLINSENSEILKHKVPCFDLRLEDIKDFVKDLRSGNGETHWRQPDLHESPGSSECSTGSNLLSQTAEEQTKIESTQTVEDRLYQDINTGSESTKTGEFSGVDGCEEGTFSGANAKQVEVLQCCDEQTNKDAVTSSLSTEFSSPSQVTPLFRSLAAGIPSPVFSESERNFLLKTLGLESPSPYPTSNTSQPPSCKRVLLQSL